MKRILLILACTFLFFAISLAQYTGGIGDGYSSGTSTAGWASVSTSQISASPASITANGSSTATITVQLKDASGTNLAGGGETIVLTTNHGTLLGSVLDNNNGTYTQTLRSSLIGETATISGTLNGVSILDTATVIFISPAGPLDHFNFTTVGNQIKGQPFSITISAKDASNITVTDFVGTVTITSTGTLSAGGGTTPVFTNGVLINHSVTISNIGSFTISASDGIHTGSSNSFSTFDVSLSQSTVSVSPASLVAGSTSAVTFQAKDGSGANIAAGGLEALFSLTGSGTSSGTFGAVTDHANGSYTAVFTGTTAGSAKNVSASISGNAVTSILPTISVTPGTVSLSQTVVSVSPATIASGSTSTITLQAKDAYGNNLTTSAGTVVFSLTGSGTSSGTFGAVTDHANGSYTMLCTGTVAGSARDVSASIGGNSITSPLPTITVTSGPVSLSQSIVSVSPTTIASGNTSSITLQAKDAYGNNLTASAGTVVFSLNGSGTSSGTFGAVTDHTNGSYTALFTGTTAGSAKNVSATIGGNSVTSTLPTITVIPTTASVIYTENSLNTPWSDVRSIALTLNYSNTSLVFQGTTSAKIVLDPWQDLQFSQGTWDAFVSIDPSLYKSLDFVINGGTTSFTINIVCVDPDGDPIPPGVSFTVPANSWLTKSIPIEQLASTPFIAIQFSAGGTNVTFYLDNIVLNSEPLPVEMTSFSATLNGVGAFLQWKTATEVNNYGFEVERRAVTTQEWTKIGFVAGAGSSASPKEYSYTDQKIMSGVYVYRLKQIDNDGAFKYSATAQLTINAAPKTFQLMSNYPNPFNPETKIQYSLPVDATVHLAVYDILGRQVAELVNEVQSAGNYEKTFRGSILSSGVYFYRIDVQAEGKNIFSQVKKMVLLK
jgi:hypothetical protein